MTLDFSRSKNVQLMCHESSRRDDLVCSVECPAGGGRTFVCEIRPAASAGGGMTVAMGVEVRMQAETAAAAAAASGKLVPPPPPKRESFGHLHACDDGGFCGTSNLLRLTSFNRQAGAWPRTIARAHNVRRV